VLKEPFPSQQTQMVADPSQSSSPFGSQVFMARTIPVHISIRAKEYMSLAGKEPEVPSSAPLSSSGPVHIKRPSTEMTIQPPPKGVLQKSSYNPNARVAQHYSIVEECIELFIICRIINYCGIKSLRMVAYGFTMLHQHCSHSIVIGICFDLKWLLKIWKC